MRVVRFILIFISLSCISYSQSIHYVNYNASGSNNGTSWTNAFTSFQSALNIAVPGDQIWVAKGTYKPSFSYDLTNTQRYFHFRLINGASIYGGFAGTESAVSQRVNFRHDEANETILSGDLNSNGKDDNDCYHVFYHPNGLALSNSAILDGFTITGGNANDVSFPHDRGGAISNVTSSPTLNNLAIVNNSAVYGGGILNNGSNPIISNVLISNNTASGSGGGIYNHSSSPVIRNALISNNNTSGDGGGIMHVNACYYSLVNVTISNNSANNGGGVFNYSWVILTFNNSIITGNSASSSGNQFYMNTHQITLNYSCYSTEINDIYTGTGTFDATNNNITTNPQFVDADNGNYRVLGVSPCVDAGLNDYNAELTDIRSFPRKLNKTTGEEGIIDMGAYEYKVSTDPLPVELTSFTASVSEGKVTLNWQTATEINNYGFEIQRSVVSGQRTDEWKVIGFVEGNGNSNSTKDYSFIDNNVINGKYSYRLKQIDNDGNFSYSEILDVEVGDLPINFDLSQNYPNPFNPTTKIKFALPLLASNSFVTLKVYDVMGREITTLVNEVKPAGEYEVVFNGNELSSGVYFYKLTVDEFVSTKKLILLK